MLDSKKPIEWTNQYWDQIKRNIGVVTISEQKKLKNTPITIFGIGGLGGSIAEQLVRSGCENIVICDNDKFETSNINRQLCTIHTIGKFKVDVLKNHLEEINPQANIKKYYEVNKFNIYSILKETKVATLTLDDPITSILVSRKCFKEKIPLIESFGFPYLCAWWFTPQSIDYESFYGLDTHNKPIELLRKEKDQISNIKMQISKFLLKFPGLRETYSREEGVLEKMYSGELPLVSIAPIIRLMASYITFEIIFTSILRIKKMILAPKIIGFDYLRMKLFILDKT